MSPVLSDEGLLLHLLKEEQKMLNGKFGECSAKAMEILVKLGEVYDAERLVRIRSAHIADFIHETIGDPGLAFIEDLANKSARVRVFTTTNVIGIDRHNWKELGICDDEYFAKELRILRALKKIGCVNTCSCTPYYSGNLPKFHDHVAWSESSTVPFVNSILGARSSREGALSALMAALTGKTPFYSYHLKKNRLGKIRVKIRKDVKGTHEFGILGYHVGRLVVDNVPVFYGLPKKILIEDLVELGSGLATSGAVGIYHIPSVTAEAKTEKQAFGGERPEQTIDVEEHELKETCSELSPGSGEVDLIALGCPHYSLRQVQRVANLLRGKTVRRNVKLWIQTSESVYAMAQRAGYIEVVKKAGGLVIVDTCASALGPLLRRVFGKLTIATDSAKQAFYLGAGRGWHNVLLGSVEKCTKAAEKGLWEE